MKLSFRSKIVTGFILTSLVLIIASSLISFKIIAHEGEKNLEGKAKAILSRLESVSNYVASQGGLETILQEVTKKSPDGNLSKEDKLSVLKQVPVFAAMKIGEENSEKEGYKFRVFSDQPRNEKI